MDKSTAIDYTVLEHQRAHEIQAEMQKQLSQFSTNGRIDSLRHTILKYVVEANYDMAHSELDRFVDLQREYQPFVFRTRPYVVHCHDIINAIRTKRSLPATGGMSPARHQELFEKVLAHFDELKQNLRKIEIVEKEVKLDDLRSTVWILKAFMHSVFVVVLFALADSLFFGGLADTFNVVMDDMIGRILNRLF